MVKKAQLLISEWEVGTKIYRRWSPGPVSIFEASGFGVPNALCGV